jgi:hypothetical protein
VPLPDYDVLAAQYGGRDADPQGPTLDALAAQFGGRDASAGARPTQDALDAVVERAEATGLGEEARALAAPQPKLSALQRVVSAVGALNPAEALLRTSPTLTDLTPAKIPEFAAEYAKTIAGGLGSAVTGNPEYNPDRRTFGDVLDVAMPQRLSDTLPEGTPDALRWGAGALEGLGRFGVSTVADIALDPSTYAGGAIAKGAGKAIGGAGRAAMRGVEAVTPTGAAALRETGQTLKDALGRNLVYAHGTSEGLGDRALEIQGRLSKAREGVVESATRRLKTPLTPAQQAEVSERLLAGKRAELAGRQRAESSLKGLVEGETARQPEIPKLVERVKEPKQAALFGKDELPLQTAADLPGDALTARMRDVDPAAEALDGSQLRLFEEPPVPREPVQLPLPKSRVTQPRPDLPFTSGELKPPKGGASETLGGVVPRGTGSPEVPVPVRTPEQQAAMQQTFAETVAAQHRAAGKAAAREATRSSDPLVQRVIDDQIARSKKFATQEGFADPYETYYPSLAADRVKAFREGTKGVALGQQGYRKIFKGRLKDADVVRNPAEAFARRESEMVRDRIIAGELRGIVRDFGKPLKAFANEEAARVAGYRILKEKGAFGKTVGYVKDADKQFLDHLTSPEYSGIDRMAAALGYDAATALFKRSVTGLFPNFHARNYLSGMVQNFERLGADALRPTNLREGHRIAMVLAKKAKPTGTITLANGRTVALRSVMQPFERRFGESSSYIADIADATRDLPSIPREIAKALGAGKLQTPGDALARHAATMDRSTFGKRVLAKATEGGAAVLRNPLSETSAHFRGARALGRFIETQQKATAYVTALRQGRTVKEALKEADLAGFDYRALTKFESGVLRRIVPFYSFARKNVELQLRTMGEHPERINQILATLQNTRQMTGGGRMTEEERAGLPGYAQSGLTVKLPDTPKGRQQFISNFGTPVEAAAELADTSRNFGLQKVGQMNPMLKVPLESKTLGFGYDTFRQKPLGEVYDARDYAYMPEVLKSWMKLREVVEPVREKDAKGKWHETGKYRKVYVADPERLHVVRNLPTSRLAGTLAKLFDEDVEAGVKTLQFFTGLKPQQMDLERVASTRDKERRRAIEDLLIRHRIGYRMERFIPSKSGK